MAVPPPSPDITDKATLRAGLRAARLAFQGDAVALCANLEPVLDGAGPIAGYVAHKGEPDILPFLAKAAGFGREIALPETGPDGAMRFVRWHPKAVMAAGRFGIPHPIDGEPIEPAVVLAPLLGFDRGGHRLGQGGGYYDRWFAGHTGVQRIGIAWSVQEVVAVPADPWDMPLHAIVTEKEWITP